MNLGFIQGGYFVTQLLFQKRHFPLFLGDSDFWSWKFRHPEPPLDEPNVRKPLVFPSFPSFRSFRPVPSFQAFTFLSFTLLLLGTMQLLFIAFVSVFDCSRIHDGRSTFFGLSRLDLTRFDSTDLP